MKTLIKLLHYVTLHDKFVAEHEYSTNHAYKIYKNHQWKEFKNFEDAIKYLHSKN